MDSQDLNVKKLCENRAWQNDHRVMSMWKKTNSPLWSHWANIFFGDDLQNYDLPPERCSAYSNWFHYNLPTDKGEAVCKSLYAKKVVKLTVQITDPYVMVIEKDVSATFSDMLGIIGNILSLLPQIHIHIK